MESNKSKIAQSLSQTNWKAILFFTSFTFLLWLILQFTKTHNVDYEISIEFTDVPVKEIISSKQVKLSANIQQSGFTLFKKKFSENKISIPISALAKKDSTYIFQSNLFIAQIAKSLKLSTEDFSINSKEFVIAFSEKATKKIPLHSNLKISYAKSYASYQGIQFEKDSIEIAGPLKDIEAISKIETEAVELKDLKKNLSAELSLKKPFSDEIVLEFNTVNYSIEVEKFTEQSFSLPIQLKNAPENYQVELLPDAITLKFQSSLEHMEEITEDDFEIECDFNLALDEASLLFPRLVKQPAKAIRTQLEPNRVEYILRK